MELGQKISFFISTPSRHPANQNGYDSIKHVYKKDYVNPKFYELMRGARHCSSSTAPNPTMAPLEYRRHLIGKLLNSHEPTHFAALAFPPAADETARIDPAFRRRLQPIELFGCRFTTRAFNDRGSHRAH